MNDKKPLKRIGALWCKRDKNGEPFIGIAGKPY